MTLVADIDFVNAVNRVDGAALTFARSGVAYNQDGTTEADGVMRTDYLTVASLGEAIVNPSPYRAMACTSDYIYASSGSKVMRTRGNDYPWAGIGSPFSASVRSMWGTDAGSLLVSIDGTPGAVYRMGKDETTFTKVLDLEVGTVAKWGWNEGAGAIAVTEYRSTADDANESRRVFLSRDDGQTFMKIFTSPNLQDGDLGTRHSHSVCPCVIGGEFRVYVAYGDKGQAGCLYLTEAWDGANADWTETYVSPKWLMQPTGILWLEGSDNLTFLSDGSVKVQGLYTHDAVAGTWKVAAQIEKHPDGADTAAKSYMFLAGRRVGNLLIAAGDEMTAGASGYSSGLWASADGENWTRILRKTLTADPLNVAGLGPDGNIWCSNATQSFAVPMPTVIRQQGALIERASDNKFTYTATETPSWSHNTTANAGVAVGDNTDNLWDSAGTYNMYWTDNGTPMTSASSYFRWKSSTEHIFGSKLQAGDRIITTCWHKATAMTDGSRDTDANGGVYAERGLFFSPHWVLRLEGNDTGVDLVYSKVRWMPIVDQWTRCVVYVDIIATATNDTYAKFWVYSAGGTSPEDLTADFYMDGICIEGAICPAEYAPNGTDRAQDVLYLDPAFPAIFTDTFTVASRFHWFTMKSGRATTGDGISYIYLRSYSVDNDNFIAVVYDVSDYKIKLVEEVAGTNAVICTLDNPTYWMAEQGINIGVTRSGTAVTLTVGVDGEIQTKSGTLSGTPTIDRSYWGSHPAGTQGGSLVFSDSRMWDAVTTDILSDFSPAIPLLPVWSQGATAKLRSRYS